MTKEGLETILEASIGVSGSEAPLYIGLIDATGFAGIDKENDVMNSHATWTEFTDYDEATRQVWTPGAVSNKTLTNPTPAQFTPNTDGSIAGYFITSSNTKGGTTGTLYDIVVFDDLAPCYDGVKFRVKYTIATKDLVP